MRWCHDGLLAVACLDTTALVAAVCLRCFFVKVLLHVSATCSAQHAGPPPACVPTGSSHPSLSVPCGGP
jgi:hypothetical protein